MKFRVTIKGARPRTVEAPSALDAAVKVCNAAGVRYAETRLKIEPVNQASIFGGHIGGKKGAANVDSEDRVPNRADAATGGLDLLSRGWVNPFGF